MRVVFVGANANEIAFVAESASPPGAPLEVEIDGVTGSVRVKVNRCRRRDEGGFLVVGRPIDLRREQREALASIGARDVPRW